MAVSTKPYLVRAIYEWCVDSGYRPFIAVTVDSRTIVPREFVRNGEIVLNISVDATNRLHIGNELVEFEARFGGVARHVSIPVENVTAIFAQETGHGMAFEAPKAAQAHVDEEEGGAPEVPAGVRGPEGQEPAGPAPEGVQPRTGGTPADDATGQAGAQPADDTARRPRRTGKPALRAAKSDEPSSPYAPTGAATVSAPTAGAAHTVPADAARPRRKPKLAAVPRAGGQPQGPKRGGNAGEEGQQGEGPLDDGGHGEEGPRVEGGRSEDERSEDGRSEGGRSEGGRSEGGRSEGGRSEGGQSEARRSEGSSRRRRSPIAAVPASEKVPGRERPSATRGAPSADDDHPEPTPPSPRKPKLTRVK